ncbi:uncharacterized protein J2S74_001416 [Evansella vedderi]|uniref:DUF418 domain-containing protein n=1 Tax=Evansella vedderi TaxID=38282 RepID=A0ABT9ZS29_9BACI|nr:DUF418 domain-containing protein [Evansella vedderi]MDQ0254043.1 uncharacterized protein [Evansella vedderi]
MDEQNNKRESLGRLTPLDASERLNHIDSLRGFALFGILIVNMLAFQYGTVGFKFSIPVQSFPNQTTNIIIEWLFQGSFYPIFSILFGFGAIIMYERSLSKTHSFNKLFFRRLVLLLIIGFIHKYFIWDGDILLTYAITGFLFMLFIKRQPKTLLIWAIVLTALIHSMGILPEDPDSEIDLQPFVEIEQDVFSTGTYTEVVTHRFTANPYAKADLGIEMDPLEREIFASFMSALTFIMLVLQALILFLLGGYIAKKRWLHNLKEHRPQLIKLTVIMLTIGIILKGAMVFTTNNALYYYGYFIGGPILGIGYITGFTLLFSKLDSIKIFRGFALVGRMALTNYLLQSIVMTTIFYGYGLGLFGKLGTLPGTILAITFFALQMAISSKWLKHHHYGPMEWLWRSGTYLKVQALKRPK